MRPYLAAIATFVVIFAACGNDDGETAEPTAAPTDTPVSEQDDVTPTATAEPTATPEPTPTPEPEPEGAVELQYFEVFRSQHDDETFLVRFAAEVENLAPLPVQGMEVEWTAYDDSGAIVGSHSSRIPALEPGDVHMYVGGASHVHLASEPADVEFEIVREGRLQTDAMPDEFDVSEVSMEPYDFNLYDADEYEVSYVVTVGDEDVNRYDLNVGIVLRNEGGDIVGAGFDSAPMNAPDTISAGASLRLDNRVMAAEPATSAEVFVNVLP